MKAFEGEESMYDIVVNELSAPIFHNFDGFLEANSVDEDGNDPSYIMFLKSLKACGNAYVADVSIEHGVYTPIRYEVEDELPVEFKRKIPRSRRGSLIRERRNLNLDGDRDLHQENPTYRTEIAHKDTLNGKRRRFSLSDEVNLGPDFGKENIMRRSPRIAQISSSSRRGDELRSDLKDDRQLGSVRKRKSLAVDYKQNNPGKKDTYKRSSRNVESSSDSQKKDQDGEVDLEFDYGRALEHGCIVDETYRIFLSGLKFIGSSCVYEYGNGKRVFYEDNGRQRSSNTDVKLQNTVPNLQIMASRTPTPCRPREKTTKDGHHILGKTKKKVGNKFDDSWFRKEIEKELRKPFEQKEYEDLLEQVNVRKPITVHRESRRGGHGKEITSQMGKSYLDSFPGLKYEIEKARSDPYKVVNLLRGFFFYLKNIPHGARTTPWKDDYCKKIMPGSRFA